MPSTSTLDPVTQEQESGLEDQLEAVLDRIEGLLGVDYQAALEEATSLGDLLGRSAERAADIRALAVDAIWRAEGEPSLRKLAERVRVGDREMSRQRAGQILDRAERLLKRESGDG